MIDIKVSFNKLLRDIEESSPNLRNTFKEISPVSFSMNIQGHKNIYVTIDGENSDVTFQENNYDFEIKSSVIELLKAAASGKINKSLMNGDTEIAIVLLNAILKSNIDLIYLIDKYFGNLPAVFTYTIVNKIFDSTEVYQDDEHRNIRKRLRDMEIRLDRLEVVKNP